ncbi:MAG: stage III sporulation protein AA [Lachnospiraceae bacterium]|nr:stage III sporulation protein AA [Lachnospiraceae bacterium]
MKQEIIHIMPLRLRKEIEKILYERQEAEEIRIRIGQPVEIRCGSKSIWLPECITEGELEEMLVFISEYSVYAYEEEIRQGYLTIEGGHRIGFAGQIRMENGKVMRMTNIRFLNIRIAREKKDCAKSILPWLYENGQVLNSLLISPPGIGKTTFLRDCIRLISNGMPKYPGKKVCVIDERSEIGACHRGIPQNDLGQRTDILDNCPKTEGMMMALRSMSPEVIAVDELGGRADCDAVEQILLSGCRVLGTMHGDKPENILKKREFQWLTEKALFQRYILLSREENGERGFHIYNQELKQLC